MTWWLTEATARLSAAREARELRERQDLERLDEEESGWYRTLRDSGYSHDEVIGFLPSIRAFWSGTRPGR